MQKRITIEIFIDTEHEDHSASETKRIDENTYQGQVWIGNDIERLNGGVLSVTAHEIGHVLTRSFIDYDEGDVKYVTSEKYRLSAEKEAWKIAGKMGVPLDQHSIDVGMGTHSGKLKINPITRRLD